MYYSTWLSLNSVIQIKTMKKTPLKALLLSSLTMLLMPWNAFSQTFSVIADKPVNGTYRLDPALPADSRYPAGTVVTVNGTPNAGFVLDDVPEVKNDPDREARKALPVV
jgi:hypothetical protein